MTKEKNKTTTFELSDGVKVELRQGKGIDVIKARRNATDEASIIAYTAALLCTFDGKKLPAEEIMEMPMGDFLLIKEYIRQSIEPKNSQQQGE